MKLGSNYWNIGWGSGAADPFKDGYENVTGDNPWKPEFLAETAFYKMHRFMDFNQTNGSTAQRWVDRTQKGDRNQRTMAYEWMIDFCNRQRADCWITVPHRTFDAPDYWTHLANLVLEQLDPELKLYIEYSNETWNFIFDQAEYCRAKGVELNLASGEYTAGFMFHVYAAVRMFDRFNSVWGADNQRLVRVVSGQAANTWMTGKHIEALNSSQVNPTHVTADAYGIAPYFGNGAATVEEARTAVATGIERAANQAQAVSGSGLRLIAYEGGQHLLENADYVSRDQQMVEIYLTYLNGVAQHVEEMCHYCHSSRYRPGGAWGAKERIGQPNEETPKYRALLAYADASPEPVEETLVPFNTLWKYELNQPSSDWTTIEFNDDAWESQEGEEPERAVYLRKEFTSELAAAEELHLTVRHDKGFVAYLNGTEVLSVPAGAEQEIYVLNQHAHLVRRGDNVLAIKLYTDNFDETDLSVNPKLAAWGRAE